MAFHFTTFVLPRAALGLPYDVPFFVLGSDEPAEQPAALPTSLHRIGHELMPFSHASMMDGYGPARVTDAWIAAVDDQYDHRAKIVILLESVPLGADTAEADVAAGVVGPDLPPWVGDLLEQRLHAATRDVPVTAGEDVMSIGIDPAAPTMLPEWADRIITPARR